MDPIRINLATYNYINKRLATLVMILVGLLLVVMSIYMIHTGTRNMDEIREYERKIAWLERNIAQRLKERIAKVEMVVIEAEEMESLKQEAETFNMLISRDLFPWVRIFTLVEDLLPNGIELNHFSHSGMYDKVMLKGTSDSMEAVTGLITKLDASDLFGTSLMQKLNMEQTSDKTTSRMNSQTVVFEIETQLDLNALFPEATYGTLGETFIQGVNVNKAAAK